MTSADIVAAWDALDVTPPKNMTRWCYSLDNSSRGKVYNALYAAGRLVPRGKAEAPQVDMPEESASKKWTETKDGATLEQVIESTEVIDSLDKAIEKCNFDKSVWMAADGSEFKTWTGAVKLSGGQDQDKRWRPDKCVDKVYYLVKLKLKRIAPKPYLDALEAIYQRMDQKAPHYEPVIYPKGSSLLVASLEDVHFGKLCWGREVGRDFDLPIADRYYRDALDDMLAMAGGFPVAEVMFPLGSDLCHVDNMTEMTTAGTPQNCDGRYQKMWETAEKAVIWAIERAAEVAPVRVLWKPGNHDYVTSYGIARVAAAHFRRHPGITFDLEPNPRKYHRYGCTLLGLDHNDKIKPASLPLLMARERPKDWAETTCREWLIAHKHMTEKWVDSFGGVTIRRVRSLSETDAWHHAHAYDSDDQAAEAFIYDRDRGFTANFVARPRREPIVA